MITVEMCAEATALSLKDFSFPCWGEGVLTCPSRTVAEPEMGMEQKSGHQKSVLVHGPFCKWSKSPKGSQRSIFVLCC